MTVPDRPSRWYQSRFARLVLTLGITLPLAFSALFMWAMWNPTEKLSELPVALVNSDQPVGEGEDAINAGAEITRNLVDSGALNWQVVAHDEAAAGLRSGDYYFIVEIPSDFSQTLSTLSDGATAPANIAVTYNDNNTTMASTVGTRVMTAVNAALLESTSSRAVGTMLTGMNDIGVGLREASEGSGRLSDGTAQLADGVDELVGGVTTRLAPGMREAADGATALSSGATQLSSGLTRLQNGTVELGAGAQRLSDGISTLAARIDADNTSAERIRLVQSQLSSISTPASQEISSVLDQVAALLDGISQLEAGSAELARQLTDPSADYRSGVDALTVGGAQLATGASALSDGLGRLDDGVSSLAENLPRLQEGSRQVDNGARQLSEGLGSGAARVPDLSDDSARSSLASLVSTPVALQSDYVAAKTVPGSSQLGPGAIPVLLAVASALVAVLVWMSFRVSGEDRRLGAHPRRPLRRLLAVSVVSVVAMAALLATMWSIVSPAPSPAHLGQVVAIVVAATLMSVALTGAAFRIFGYAGGALVSLAAWMLQLFAFGGIWMVETVPAPLRALHPVAPMTYTREGLIAAFNGGPGFASALAVVLGITAIGLLGQFAAHRKQAANPEIAPLNNEESTDFVGVDHGELVGAVPQR
ncbi:YhgE/Pip family protein [Hoyosella rhizosphaerae]|uniref:Membrane protein n=1 Tax=Hoyosella rhizosphaerae TaxID=1755582 RepID=A0A916X9L8_9ACTN|nr:YhgE/Pip domain-containing protein [Hoyosella rhizosphaerae]MBN4926966.1 YhgE/Pip family protein [Hoyosella rhizosphaerae]GGC55092.1 membrane protein [Hoyosella rhizosphaerae]